MASFRTMTDMDNNDSSPVRTEAPSRVQMQHNTELADLKSDIEALKRELEVTRKERDDWQWAYQLTEGILKADRKWHGVNERFSNQSPIVAAKLAKELMGRKRSAHVNPAVPQVVVPDYYRDLIEWLGRGMYRIVACRDKSNWKARDEAMRRELTALSIDDLLKSEAWEKFRKL